MVFKVSARGKAVVTGAGGFLGRYIVAEMASQGWTVSAICRRSAAQTGPEFQTVEWHQIDLPSPRLDDLLDRVRPEVLIHAAGPASVPASISDPEGDFRGSAGVFFQVLESVRRNSPESRVLFLSSAAVYGNPPRLPVSEDSPLRPISPYGFHKLICERLCEEFYGIYNIPTCSVRIFSAYGPGLGKQVFWDICQKALTGKAISLLGTGRETRDFVHARDVAGAVELVARRGNFQADVFNVGVGEETRIEDLARMLLSGLGRDIPITFSGEHRCGDPVRWRADIRRLLDFGFAPRYSIADGVTSYCDWILDNLQGTGKAQN